MDYYKGNDTSISQFLNGKDGGIPKPPRRGEIIRCLVCGEPMPPSAFSKIPAVRKREFKWQCHEKCINYMLDVCDRETTGLLAERKNDPAYK